MKGIAYTEFGGPDVLTMSELPDPPVYTLEVLVRVHAIGVNPLDTHIRAGYMQPYFEHRLPIIPGHDLAGEVVAVGPFVTQHQVGDRVFAMAMKDYQQAGAYAELVTAPVRSMARIPDSLSYEQAAALPMSGLAAWQALDAVDVGPGDTVLINAAAGGVGHLAVQLARHKGARRLIGLGSEGNHEFIRSLGAEPLAHGPDIEARVAELVGGDGKVDVVLDPFGGELLEETAGCGREVSRVVCLTDPTVLSLGGKWVCASGDHECLAMLAGLVESGELRVEVQQVLPLSEAAAAHRLIEERHVRGKVVLTV